jgi:hypothetical protein
MSLEDDILIYLKNINKQIQANKYTRDELRKVSTILRVESTYMKYIIKTKLNLEGDNILIDTNRRIISDYIKILETRINNERIKENPELYYLIISYLRIILNDNKLLLNSSTRFIKVYLSSIKYNKPLNSSLNIISLSMEVSDNINTKFSKNIYTNDNDFLYIKNIIGTVLEHYEEIKLSRDNSSNSCTSSNSSVNENIDKTSNSFNTINNIEHNLNHSLDNNLDDYNTLIFSNNNDVFCNGKCINQCKCNSPFDI